jgi:hypothetical protein
VEKVTVEKVMANENEEVVNTHLTPAEVVPEKIGKFILEPFNHAIAVGMRKALEQGVQTHEVLELLLNQLTSVIAMIEPSGAREQTIKDITNHLAKMTQHYVRMRHTSPGGVILPNGAAQ